MTAGCALSRFLRLLDSFLCPLSGHLSRHGLGTRLRPPLTFSADPMRHCTNLCDCLGRHNALGTDGDLLSGSDDCESVAKECRFELSSQSRNRDA
jgi:hypothetical protein